MAVVLSAKRSRSPSPMPRISATCPDAALLLPSASQGPMREPEARADSDASLTDRQIDQVAVVKARVRDGSDRLDAMTASLSSRFWSTSR